MASSWLAGSRLSKAAAYASEAVTHAAGAAVGASPLLQSAVASASTAASRVLANPRVQRTMKGVQGRWLGKHDFALAARARAQHA